MYYVITLSLLLHLINHKFTFGARKQFKSHSVLQSNMHKHVNKILRAVSAASLLGFSKTTFFQKGFGVSLESGNYLMQCQNIPERYHLHINKK